MTTERGVLSVWIGLARWQQRLHWQRWRRIIAKPKKMPQQHLKRGRGSGERSGKTVESLSSEEVWLHTRSD